MRNLLLTVLAFSSSFASAAVGPLINGNQINPQTAISIASMSVTGAGGLDVTGPITGSSGSFTATGNTQYSVVTSSGINVLLGGVYAAFFKATTGFFGNLWGNVVGNVTGNLTGNVTGNVTGNADTATKATNVAGGASGSLPYQSALDTTAMLAKSINGYALQLAAGIPSWVPAVSSATNIAAGAAGSIPYQSAANTTAMLAAGAATQVLMGGASAPSWSTLAGSTGALNISGLAAYASLFDHTPTGCSAGNYPTTISAAGNFGGCTSASSALAGSTFTYVNMTGTYSNTTFAVALGTVTLVTTGHKVRITANISCMNNTTFNSFIVNVIEDGAFITSDLVTYTSTKGMQYQVTAVGGNTLTPMAFSLIIRAPSAASHSYGLQVRVGGSNGTCEPTNMFNMFGVEETQ